jgi:hypothetical protein
MRAFTEHIPIVRGARERRAVQPLSSSFLFSRLPITFSHHDIVRSENRNHVRDQIASRHVVERPHVDERRRSNVQSIRARAAVADDEKAEFTLAQ